LKISKNIFWKKKINILIRNFDLKDLIIIKYLNNTYLDIMEVYVLETFTIIRLLIYVKAIMNESRIITYVVKLLDPNERISKREVNLWS
jgi:hypothetical protein